MIKRALGLALVAVAIPAAAWASPGRFTAHAVLQPTGCVTNVSGTIVSVTGCVATGRFVGTVRGTIEYSYTAKVDISRNGGSQQGTVTLRGPAPQDRLVFRLTGSVTMSTGLSKGTWRALERRGSFAKAPRTGTYTSKTPDHGTHVSFDVRG